MSTVAKEVDKQAEAEEKLGKSHTRFLCNSDWGRELGFSFAEDGDETISPHP